MRQGFWETPEGERWRAELNAEAKGRSSTSFVGFALHEKSAATSQFRATCVVVAVFYVPVVCLALRDIMQWCSSRRTYRQRSDRHLLGCKTK